MATIYQQVSVYGKDVSIQESFVKLCMSESGGSSPCDDQKTFVSTICYTFLNIPISKVLLRFMYQISAFEF